MRPIKTAVVVGIVLSAWLSLAFAQGEEGQPCMSDAKKFCGDVQPGEGRIAQCMKQHESELSKACENHIKAAKKEFAKIREACRSDAEKLCKDVQPGDGRIARCMKQNESQVSEACKKATQEARTKERKRY